MKGISNLRKIQIKRLATTKILLSVVLLLLVISVILSLLSIFPISSVNNETRVIIDDYFKLSPSETLRHGLGSFRGGENISISVGETANKPINFSIITYGGTLYSNASESSLEYSFIASTDYYETVFICQPGTVSEISFKVTVQDPQVLFLFSWLATPAKILFFSSWACLTLILSKFVYDGSSESVENKIKLPILNKKKHRKLLAVVLLSLAFWLILLAANSNSYATLENWYTDHMRHPYSAVLFTHVGFSIFDTPLGKPASNDSSFYKFVTWPEMPHLYPIGSIFFFLPFGLLLEQGVAQLLVVKMEIALFLLVSHVCLYYFLKHFWKQRMNLSLKTLSVYLFYVILVVSSANGMFDTVPFLFSIIAVILYLRGRYDYFILFVAVSATLKYQAGIFLFPLAISALMKLFRQSGLSGLIKNKAVLLGAFLIAVDGFTAYLSAPFLIGVRPELVMNGINLFSPHSQIPWVLQSFLILLTLASTLLSAIYLLRKNSLFSLFMISVLLTCFTLPYFQPWYLSLFFVYPIIPEQKKTIEVMMAWLVFMVIVLSFGVLVYNPLQILNNIRHALGLP